MVPPQASPTDQALLSLTPYDSRRGRPSDRASQAASTTAASTQPPLTEPAMRPDALIAMRLPGGLGELPQVSVTVASATASPSCRQRAAIASASSSGRAASGVVCVMSFNSRLGQGASLDRPRVRGHNPGAVVRERRAVPSARLEIVVVTPFAQNCQILWDEGSRRGVVVDPGGDVPQILARIAALGVMIEAILLTHGHLDHAGGAAELRDTLPALADGARVPVIGPDRRDAFLLSGIDAQASALGIAGLHDVEPDRYLQEGETLSHAGCRLKVLHVPGHTPGHVVFVEETQRFGLVGDTLFRGSVGRTDFPYGDGPLLIAGVKAKLLTLGDELAIVPGHGAGSTIGQERRGNPFLVA